MPSSIFISYRRRDSQHATFAIADRLSWAFGAEEVFFDRGSIKAGDQWPDSLERALAAAKVLVLVVGRSWLKTTGKRGRRRIDDWVRREILAGLEAHKAKRTEIIPVLLDEKAELRAAAFDRALKPIAQIQPTRLSANHWEDGLEELIVRIEEKSGLTRMPRPDGRNPNGSPARPRRKQSSQRPMNDAEVRSELEQLARWQVQWGPHSWGNNGRAQEIVKSYDFPSFADVVAFMASAAKEIDTWKPPHHPRWENQWKVLTVFFTTWDVNCRVTALDIEAAKKFDELVGRWNPAATRSR
jgi:pterin-4a-carbinolamine dehydratase